MQRKLTIDEIELYKNQAKTIYQQEKLDAFYDSFIKMDLETAEALIRWTDQLNKDPSVVNAIEANRYFETEDKNIPDRCKKLGCTDEQIQSVSNAGKRLAIETDLFKNLFEQYIKAQQLVMETLESSKSLDKVGLFAVVKDSDSQPKNKEEVNNQPGEDQDRFRISI